MTGCSNGLKAGEDSCRSGMVGISIPISAAVITACTPGRASAALTSIARMRPWATVLRRITACRRSSRARSSTNWPRPRRKRKSSMRSTGLPTKALVLRFKSMSYHDRGALVEQCPRDAHGGPRPRLGIAARRSSLQLDGKTPSGAFGLDLVHVARRVGIGDQLHLRGIESQSRERHRRRDIGILRIEQGRLAGGALVEHGALRELAEVDHLLGRRAAPGA